MMPFTRNVSWVLALSFGVTFLGASAAFAQTAETQPPATPKEAQAADERKAAPKVAGETTSEEEATAQQPSGEAQPDSSDDSSADDGSADEGDSTEVDAASDDVERSETDAEGAAGTAGAAVDDEATDGPSSKEAGDVQADAGPGNERHSASANQGTELQKDDDYAGASDAGLVKKKEAPKNLILGVALDLTWPLGSAADFVGNASIQGLSLDLRYYFWKNVALGAGVAFDALSKKTDATVEWENATITGTQLREISFTPITLKGYYAWRDSETFVPYVAAGAGAARSVRRLVTGFSSLSDASWHFALVPEVGLHIPAGPTLLQTNMRLTYLPAAAGVDDQLYLNFSFGLAIQ